MPIPPLETLLQRRANFLGFVRRRVGGNELAEDILQAAYLRALAKPDHLPAQESVVAWFYRVLRNAVIDHYRHASSEAAAMGRWAEELKLQGGEAGEPAVAGEAHTFACQCLEFVVPTLRPAYSELLREVDLADAPLSDFAQRHRLTPGNAAVRAHRARAALRRELARTCGACAEHGCRDCVCRKQPRDMRPVQTGRRPGAQSTP